MREKKIAISITISKSVYNILDLFRNKSRIVDEILLKLFDGITEKELLEMIKLAKEGGSISDYILNRYASSLSLKGISLSDNHKENITESFTPEQEINDTVADLKKTEKPKPKIDPKDFW